MQHYATYVLHLGSVIVALPSIPCKPHHLCFEVAQSMPSGPYPGKVFHPRNYQSAAVYGVPIPAQVGFASLEATVVFL